MITAILIALGVIVFSGALGGAAWFIFYTRRSAQAKKTAREAATAEGLPFRWRYVMLPVALLLLSILLSAYFYHQLPNEVAYHFKLDGSPDKWLSREMITLWLLVPQLLLTLVAGAITWGITKLGIIFRQPEATWINPERILLLMGNMIALPQIILCFAMLDVFSYNSYQIHLLPLWVFTLIIMVIGGIILGIIFIRAMRRAWRTTR